MLHNAHALRRWKHNGRLGAGGLLDELGSEDMKQTSTRFNLIKPEATCAWHRKKLRAVVLPEETEERLQDKAGAIFLRGGEQSS